MERRGFKGGGSTKLSDTAAANRRHLSNAGFGGSKGGKSADHMHVNRDWEVRDWCRRNKGKKVEGKRMKMYRRKVLQDPTVLCRKAIKKIGDRGML